MVNPFFFNDTATTEIYTETEFLETHATVVYFEPKQGMGLIFTEMPAFFAGVLNKWLEQAGKQKAY